MITYAVYVDFDRDGSWTDITAFVKDLQAGLGFEDPEQSVATVGFCQITLDNQTRDFSPLVTSGAYYGKLLPRLPLRIDISEGGDTWTAFRGMTTRWYAQSGLYGPRLALEADTFPLPVGRYWEVVASDGSAGDVYAGGDLLQKADAGDWTVATGQDMSFKITLVPRPRVTLAWVAWKLATREATA